MGRAPLGRMARRARCRDFAAMDGRDNNPVATHRFWYEWKM
jgi:hypothetical protein